MSPVCPLEGRVVRQVGPVLFVCTDAGLQPARIGGALAHLAPHAEQLPTIGDHVTVIAGLGGGEGLIVGVHPRTSLLRRRAAGSQTHGQPLAANVDIALIVAALDASFSARRIERAVLLAWDSGAQPVVVLTKADLALSPGALDDAICAVEAVAPGVLVIPVSARSGEGLDALRAALPPKKTAVLLGVSGAGKSTLTNVLLGTAQFDTQPLSADHKRGRHTTSHRELVTLPHGALLIDGPGVRELGMLDDTEVLRAFADIEALAPNCRFRDCTHDVEPGCAVQAALLGGALDSERLLSFHKLKREVAFAQARAEPQLMRERKAASRLLSKAVRSVSRDKRRDH